MAFDKSFSDEIKKEIAYKEYEIESYNQDVRLKTGEYIGNVAHIYDNVNDNEEQVFVLTNNGQGEKQKAVPYTASDEERTQIHDVTVLMKGSETEISTQKLCVILGIFTIFKRFRIYFFDIFTKERRS